MPFTNPRTCIAKRLAKLQAALERFEVESLTDLEKKSLGFVAMKNRDKCKHGNPVSFEHIVSNLSIFWLAPVRYGIW